MLILTVEGIPVVTIISSETLDGFKQYLICRNRREGSFDIFEKGSVKTVREVATPKLKRLLIEDMCQFHPSDEIVDRLILRKLMPAL